MIIMTIIITILIYSEYNNSETDGLNTGREKGQDEKQVNNNYDNDYKRRHDHPSAGERIANSNRLYKGNRNGKDGANTVYKNGNNNDEEKERTCWCFSPL